MAFKSEYVLSSTPEKWVLDAEGTFYSATLFWENIPKFTPGNSYTTEEVFKILFSHRIVGFHLAHTIELLLKALLLQEEKDNEIHKFQHNLVELKNQLITKNVLGENDDIDDETLQFATTLLYWRAKYPTPKPNYLKKELENLFEIHENDKVKIKANQVINPKKNTKLKKIAELLFTKASGIKPKEKDYFKNIIFFNR